MMQRGTLADYEGLIFSTSARYAPILDDDAEDIQQILRMKVWRALEVFDPRRSALSEENYVFGCVRNQVKDLLKSQSRRNDARGGQLDYIDGKTEVTRAGFELEYLSESDELVFASVEEADYPLPSTLSVMERAVVWLLILDFNQTEISRQLGVSRAKVRSAHQSVRDKMADWKPGVNVEPQLDAQPDFAQAA
jgi:RNA polymerase sigma factor (sigma-70 family)